MSWFGLTGLQFRLERIAFQIWLAHYLCLDLYFTRKLFFLCHHYCQFTIQVVVEGEEYCALAFYLHLNLLILDDETKAHIFMPDRSVIRVIIPALNEEESIGKVIGDMIPGLVKEIIVVDNGSTDGTSLRSRQAGATVLDEKGGDMGMHV